MAPSITLTASPSAAVGRQVERKRGGGELPLVGDRQRRRRRGHRGDARQRHQGAVRTPDVDMHQLIGAGLLLAGCLQHDAVVVHRRERRRHLPLAEGVVEGVVDRLEADSKAAGAVAIDVDREHQPRGLLIGRHVAQLREALQLGQHLGAPGLQLAEIGVLQRVLVLGARRPATHAHVLHRLKEERHTRDLRQLGTQAGDDLIGGALALVVVLETDEHRPGVASAARAADERDGVVDVGIVLDDLVQLLLRAAHRPR